MNISWERKGGVAEKEKENRRVDISGSMRWYGWLNKIGSCISWELLLQVGREHAVVIGIT